MGRGLSNLGCAAQLGIFAVIVIGGLTLLQSLTGAPAALLGSLQAAAPQPTPTTVVLPPVLDVITRQPRLQTVSYFLSTVADSSKVVGLLKQEQRVILVACGKVTAGVELSKLNKDKVKADGADATIQLPDSEIFDTLLIEDHNPPCTYVAFRSDGILLEAAKDLESDARRQAIEKFRQTALEQGIIQEARVNAQTEIRRLLFLAGYKSVEFTP